MKSWICPLGHKNHYDAAFSFVCDCPTTVKVAKPLKRTPVKKVSDKRKEQNTLYSQARATWIIGKRCACCGDPATEVHHKAGRTNDLLLEKKYWLPVCNGCHRLITEDSAWAVKEGYSLPRNTKPQETI